ncbi:papain like cysteine protease AvrRpt2 [Chitinophaga skermanii]|uniref:Papain like cysteine protease AvrRpt2 n=1 Tax=Chitinophaga skermanii TaxID=331697 RepID=A0A327QTF2_9BACT|nr:papain-like cysteine protease family protein [Chitinophaga skermanii]RAJ05037.1 papain like cysteine protease AvrRpt2 [Chitinophaga skermanii]
MKKLLVWLGCACILLSTNLHAQTSCQQLGQNYFSCGVPSAEFQAMQANAVNGGRQQQSNWCWAACIQMVLNYHGLYVLQSSIVERIFISPFANEPADEQKMLRALSGWAPDANGRYSAIHAQGGVTTVNEIVTGLSGKWPLIVGLNNPNGGVGHAYVLTAIYYSNVYDNYGNIIGYQPDKVVLRDPWPTNQSRQEWDWNTFQSRCFMALKVWVTRS